MTLALKVIEPHLTSPNKIEILAIRLGLRGDSRGVISVWSPEAQYAL